MAGVNVESHSSSHMGCNLCHIVVCLGSTLLLLSLIRCVRGIFSTAMAGVNTWSEAMAFRFLLGIFEAGYGPGIPYFLSFFYLRQELGVRIGFFLAAAVSTTLSVRNI
jgi:hypothetical protein